jgi:hypothetical protein
VLTASSDRELEEAFRSVVEHGASALLVLANATPGRPIESGSPYELIERMYPELPKIELFARNARDGWNHKRLFRLYREERHNGEGTVFGIYVLSAAQWLSSALRTQSSPACFVAENEVVSRSTPIAERWISLRTPWLVQASINAATPR